eukprot:scaffold9441_cov167-Amphora_coffeaeformis.AAC.14
MSNGAPMGVKMVAAPANPRAPETIPTPAVPKPIRLLRDSVSTRRVTKSGINCEAWAKSNMTLSYVSTRVLIFCSKSTTSTLLGIVVESKVVSVFLFFFVFIFSSLLTLALSSNPKRLAKSKSKRRSQL